jgi:hypothetical protein
MLDPNGNLLTEVADDSVRATAAAASAGDGAVASHWREVEVDLGERGDKKLLVAIGERLTREEARPSRYPSKLCPGHWTRTLRASPATPARRWSGSC